MVRIAVGSIVSLIASSGYGQCHQWLQTPQTLPPLTTVTGTSAFELDVQDLDGPGPLPEELLIGLRSTEVGSVLRYDGARFLAMPGRMAPLTGQFLLDFERHQGRWYAGGRFVGIDGAQVSNWGLAQFVGGVWQAVPAAGASRIENVQVLKLVSTPQGLLVGGTRLRVWPVSGSPTFSMLARLSSTNQWTDLATFATSDTRSTASIAFDGPQVLLGGLLGSTPNGSVAILRGDFNNFATDLTGSACVSFAVRDIIRRNGDLLALGSVTNGPQRVVLLRWDGTTWVDAGFPVVPGQVEDLHGLVDFQNTLYAYGSTCNFGMRVPRLMRQEAGAWANVLLPSSRINSDTAAAFFDAAAFQGTLYLGIAGMPGLVTFDGTNFAEAPLPLSQNNQGLTFDMLIEGDDVYIAGNRLVLWALRPNPPAIPTSVARLTQDGWAPVGTGMLANATQVLRWRDNLVVRLDTNVINVLQGTTWVNPLPGVTGVSAIAVWQDDLIIAASVAGSGTVIHRYDGVNLTPMSPVSPPRGFNNAVRKIIPFGDSLAVSGSFSQMVRSGDAAQPRNSVVAWNGTDWQNLGTQTLAGDFTDLLADGPSLFAQGPSMALGGFTATNTLRWNGTTWAHSQGEAPRFDSDLEIVSGVPHRTGQTGIARYDQATNAWIRLPIRGASQSIAKIARDPQDRWIHAYGIAALTVASPSEALLLGYGRLTLGTPVLERTPIDATAAAGASVGFSVDTLGDRATFQWRRNGTPLTNGPTTHGSIIADADGPYLRIDNVRLEDAGEYDCIVTCVCTGINPPSGSTTSPTGTLTVVPAICDSVDFNNDGVIRDPADIDAFFSVFSEGDCLPVGATCNDLDFNNDGSLFDPCDMDSFLLVFSEGPCTRCGV